MMERNGPPRAGSLPFFLAACCWISWLLALCILGNASSSPVSSSKNIVVDLKSSWEATSLLHEAAEFFGQADSKRYFQFTELWRETRGKSCWERLQNTMKSMVSDQIYQMSLVALASRQYSPRLETFRQLSSQEQAACCWAIVNDRQMVTDPGSIDDVLSRENLPQGEMQILDIDHVYSGGFVMNHSTVILYGAIDSECSVRMHDAILSSIQRNRAINYLWRPIPFRKDMCVEAASCSGLGANATLTIPGYGVELAIKNMEYNARDDSSELHVEKETETTNMKRLDITTTDFTNIGVKSVQKILNSNDGVAMLQEVSQNFPSMVDTISTVDISDDLYAGVHKLATLVAPEAQIMLINGVSVNMQDLSWHELLETLHHESEFVAKLHDLGIPSKLVPSIYKLRSRDDQSRQDGFRLDFQPQEHVFWMSDLERDENFRGLPKNLEYMLQPSFFGQAPAIRRNLLTAVMIVDVGTRGGAMALSSAYELISQGLPVRLGVVPVELKSASDDKSKYLNEIFIAMSKVGNERLAIQMFAQAATSVSKDEWQNEASFPSVMKALVDESLGRRWNEMSHDFDDIPFKKFDKYMRDSQNKIAGSVEKFKKEASNMIDELGLHSFPEAGGILVMNGALHNIESTSMWRPILINAWQAETAAVQKLIYEGQLSDSSEDLLADILLVHNAVPSFNPRIIRKTNILGSHDFIQDAQMDIKINNVSQTLDLLESMNIIYFHEMSLVGQKGQYPVTHWLIVDPFSLAGLRLIEDSLSHEYPKSRIGIVVNPNRIECSDSSMSDLEAFLLALSGGLIGKATEADHFDMLSSLSSLCNQRDCEENIWKIIPEGVFDSKEDFQDFLKQAKINPLLEKHCTFSRSHIGVSRGDSGVLTNGKFLKARWPGDISLNDFQILEYVASHEQYATDELYTIIGESVTEEKQNDLAAMVSSVMVSHMPPKENEASFRLIKLFNGVEDAIKIKTPSRYGFAMAPLEIKALFDPLSKASQQFSTILAYLRSHLHANLEIILNPKLEYSDMPLKTYYRFVLPSINNAEELVSPKAIIPSLPLQDTLTLGMDVPEMWLISPTHSKHDLDNIQLGNLEKGEDNLIASFRLDSILVTGMCVDYHALESGRGSKIHPRGVQLNLGTPEEPTKFDTLVMSNLGYFQLKASPGIWQLRLAEGRSKEIYEIKSVVGRSTHSLMKHAAYIKDQAAVTPVASFAGEHLLLLLSPNPGHLDEDVLSPSSTDVSTTTSSENDTIHVFTVASGHMYERLQKIMILSATKRASRKMKFWFIDNYMSPQMKEFIPIMASLYDFEYEFVTYKWPSWLHKQTEKQRIIWAYKILFLDVLFPLGLKKVIFCDSDQVIRADLAELWDYDLKGAPYGYTPFCDNNKEMDGFRFWKQGFWENHLKGKPYHISALYVVDLEKFRSMAAGDQLRVIYDRLSKDPNSLSNLDQDLPNFAQHEVPIASLPQEWLWCETWCGEATRKQAKTIDLCNNPLTKEPKLKSARRIIAEWPDLNREVEELTVKVEGYLAGKVTLMELNDDSARFQVSLLPMVEGSVKAPATASNHIEL